MRLCLLNLTNFRNYTSSNINFSEGVNFVVGSNAQGKTNMLESIYLSSVGKSPKNSKDKQIVKFNEQRGKIDLDFYTNAGKKNIQIYLDVNNKKYIKINNLNVLKLTELVGVLSVVYFSPDELKLIKEVPEDRRNFLDISISQFDKVYLYDLLKYDKILKQRNAILKDFSSPDAKKEQLQLFTPQLIETATRIIEKRLKFIEKLKAFAVAIHKEITLSEELEISYSYTPKQDKTIAEDLALGFERIIDKELELGYTCLGPHRDDIVFKIDGKDCRAFASQGQQRTVALVLKLALMEVVKAEIGEYPILLLDDVLSELDSGRQNRLLNMCQKFQTLITCTAIPNTNIKYNKIFVKKGNIEKKDA